jgi:hypothetical protein
MQAGGKKSGLRTERTYTAAVAALSFQRMQREGHDDAEPSLEWSWPEISLPRITHVLEADSDDDTEDGNSVGGIATAENGQKKIVVELGEAPSPRAGHCATLIEEDDSVLYFGGTAAGPNSTMAFQHMLLYNEVRCLIVDSLVNLICVRNFNETTVRGAGGNLGHKGTQLGSTTRGRRASTRPQQPLSLEDATKVTTTGLTR